MFCTFSLYNYRVPMLVTFIYFLSVLLCYHFIANTDFHFPLACLFFFQQWVLLRSTQSTWSCTNWRCCLIRNSTWWMWADRRDWGARSAARSTLCSTSRWFGASSSWTSGLRWTLWVVWTNRLFPPTAFKSPSKTSRPDTSSNSSLTVSHTRT